MFIPIGLFVFLFRSRYLVSLMILYLVFVAASVLDFSIGGSDFGVQPYYFTAVLLAIRALPVLFRARWLGPASEPAIGKMVAPLVKFWKWATVSAFVFPVIFKGIEVINPRSVEGDVMAAVAIHGDTSPLYFSFANVGQVAYLTLSVVAVLYVVRSSRDAAESLCSLRALRVAIMLVSLIALVQAFADSRGWSFPYQFFNGNPAYLQAFDAESGGVPRVNSTFTEASSAGGFLAASTLGLLATRLLGGPAGVLEIVLAALGLILTTATTGYATILIGIALLLIYFACACLRKRLPRRVLMRSISVVFLAAIGVAFLLASYPPLGEAIVASSVDKSDTISFFSRVSVDLYSLDLLFKTYGLGAGLGSNRPSSLVAALLGNVGVIGTLLFILCVFRFVVQLFEVSRHKGGEPVALLSWMMVGLLIAQAIALPDLSWPPLWAALITAASTLASPTCPKGAGRWAMEHVSVEVGASGNSALA